MLQLAVESTMKTQKVFIHLALILPPSLYIKNIVVYFLFLLSYLLVLFFIL